MGERCFLAIFEPTSRNVTKQYDMLEHGYTMAELARQTGIHYSIMSKIIKGLG